MSNAIATKEHAPVQAIAPAASESAAVIQMIERVAMNPNADIDKLQKLLEMRDKIEAGAAKKAFFTALSAAQAEMKPVARTAENEQTKSTYATLEAIADAITPIQTKHGFGLTYDTADCPVAGHYRILGELVHDGGYSKEYHVDIPIDNVGMKGNANKTATHAFGSTIAYGRRYLKLMIFDIATKKGDDDGNAAGRGSLEYVSDEQIEKLQSRLIETGSDPQKFLNYLKIPALSNIYASKFDDAMRLIDVTAAARAKKEAENA